MLTFKGEDFPVVYECKLRHVGRERAQACLSIRSLEDNTRAGRAVRDLSQDLVTVRAEGFAHIWHFLLNNLAQQRRDLIEEAVTHIIVPC